MPGHCTVLLKKLQNRTDALNVHIEYLSVLFMRNLNELYMRNLSLLFMRNLSLLLIYAYKYL